MVCCERKCGMMCDTVWCVVSVMSFGDGRCRCGVCSGMYFSVCCALWCVRMTGGCVCTPAHVHTMGSGV